MYKLFLLLALAASACQPPTPATTAAVSTRPSTASPATPPGPALPPLPSFFAPADTLTAAMRAVLQANDLSPLWHNRDNYAASDSAFDGFFGTDHYRFGMFFSHVSRDPANPARYYVRGKCNYHKSRNIRSFAGTLTVRQLQPLAYAGFLQAHARQFSRAADTLAGRLLTARARLQLQEENQPNSGIFEGEALLDFFVVPGQPAGYVYVFDHEGSDDRLPTRGGSLLLRGNRRNRTTGQVKPFLVGPSLGAIAPFVFKDFMLDERMGQINPKYAKLGWNEYWRVDEWWADSPKPALSL